MSDFTFAPTALEECRLDAKRCAREDRADIRRIVKLSEYYRDEQKHPDGCRVTWAQAEIKMSQANELWPLIPEPTRLLLIGMALGCYSYGEVKSIRIRDDVALAVGN